MARILLTGATGLLGSSLVPSLLKRGHEVVCLVRPQGDRNPVARLQGAFGPSGRLSAVSGDVILPLAGMKRKEIEAFRGRIDKFIHCAASIKFDQELAEETWQINVGGTENVLALATRLGVREFHHISTIYVAGDAKRLSETDFEVGQARNPYEASKEAAERLTRGWQGGQYSIYRLGVIVGDSITGYTSSFDGYYGFFLPFWRLRRTLQEKWGRKSAEYAGEGIRFTSEGILHLPLYIDCSFRSTINIVPINWVAEMLAKLIGIPARDRVFHLADTRPPKVQWAAETSLRHLGITGLKYTRRPESSLPPLLEKLQRRIDREVGRYFPYIQHEVRLISGNVIEMLDGEYSPPPVINSLFLANLLDFAKSVGFGQEGTK